MQLTKPDIRRVYVQVVNPLTGKSRSITLYNTDENETVRDILKLARDRENSPAETPAPATATPL